MARGRVVKWLRIDANMTRNPKVTAVKADGLILYLRGLSYCAEHETDGLIPRHAVHGMTEDFVALGLWTTKAEPVDNSADVSGTCREFVGNVHGLSRGHVDGASNGASAPGLSTSAIERRRQRLVKRLVDAGLWHKTPHGYEVNDYLKYQPEKSELEEREERRREADRERKRRERAKKRGVPLSGDCRNVTPVTPYTKRGYSLRSNPPFDETTPEGGTPALGGAGAPVASSAEQPSDIERVIDEHGPQAIIRRLADAKRMA